MEKNKAIWSCKIGEVDRDILPLGSDLPMREAVRRAYIEITGQEPRFNFSGWAGELTPIEREVADEIFPTPAPTPEAP
jgi:hypothetical protein